MKTLKMLCLLGALLMALTQVSEAVSVSSQPVGIQTGAPFLIRENESVNYIITSTVPTVGVHFATIAFQFSTDAQNWITEFTTAPTATPGWSVSGTLPIKDFSRTYYRYKVLGSTGGAPIITISDADDNVSIIRSNKGVDRHVFNDNGFMENGEMRADRYSTTMSTPDVAVTSTTQFVLGVSSLPINNQWIGGNTYLKTGYSVLYTTGSGVTLNSTPTISTATAREGDRIQFQGFTSSVTFQSELTLPGSALRLGAATRALGKNDTISFVFRAGFWREEYFANNDE